MSKEYTTNINEGDGVTAVGDKDLQDIENNTGLYRFPKYRSISNYGVWGA